MRIIIMITIIITMTPVNGQSLTRDDVAGMTYDQCREFVLTDIAELEARSGRIITPENKMMAVEAYCGDKK